MTEEELQLLLAYDIQVWEAYLPYLSSIIQQQVAIGSFVGLTTEQIVANIMAEGLTAGQLATVITTQLNNFSRSVTYGQMQNAPKNTLYIYVGPIDGKTREICLRQASADKLTQSQIIRNFGASVLKEGGGYNCRHEWEEFEEEFGVQRDLYNPDKAGNLLDD